VSLKQSLGTDFSDTSFILFRGKKVESLEVDGIRKYLSNTSSSPILVQSKKRKLNSSNAALVGKLTKDESCNSRSLFDKQIWIDSRLMRSNYTDHG